ncbi:MAG: tetratricopeptide repeat protein [Thermoanaerobaculia bacterium]|nr:tetratricopeptide repeat protein [Thermoanaerobaculia bacterium]
MTAVPAGVLLALPILLATAPPEAADPHAADLAAAREDYVGGRYEAAEAKLEQVLAAAPEHAAAHYELGAVYEKTGRREEAIHHYGLAFTHDPRLLFDDLNPRLITNRLVLESLLEARRWQRLEPPPAPWQVTADPP